MSSRGGSSRNRNDSPAPKAKGKASPKSPAAVTPVTAKPAEPAQKKETLIFGFHPEVFKALIIAPACFAGIIISTVFFEAGKELFNNVDKWLAPIGKVLINHADTVAIVAAFACVAPILLVFIVNIWRAMMDLGHLSGWQQVLLGLLVTIALATAVTTEQGLAVWDAVASQWKLVRDPIEDFINKKSESILAGVAIFCLAPIGAAFLAYILQGLWGCRVKLVAEEKKK